MSKSKGFLTIVLAAGVLFSILAVHNIFVMADDTSYKELGIWWVESYHGLAGDLTQCQEDAENFRDRILLSTGWSCVKSNGNDNARESHFERSAVGGSDSSEADSVDIFWFSGHGAYRYFFFGTDYDGDDQYINKVYAYAGNGYNEPSWGDTDLEWAYLSACETLGTSATDASKWNDAFNGLHGICGYRTTCDDIADTGYGVGNYLRLGYTVYYSWYHGTYDTQPNTHRAAIYSANIRIDALNYNYGTGDYLNSILPDYDGGSVIKTGYTYDSWYCGVN